jgi:hypothetical protein
MKQHQYIEGEKALENFKRGMKALASEHLRFLRMTREL